MDELLKRLKECPEDGVSLTQKEAFGLLFSITNILQDVRHLQAEIERLKEDHQTMLKISSGEIERLKSLVIPS